MEEKDDRASIRSELSGSKLLLDFASVIHDDVKGNSNLRKKHYDLPLAAAIACAALCLSMTMEYLRDD
jgi:hypothetical protein